MIQKILSAIIYIIFFLLATFFFAGNAIAQHAVSTLAGTSSQGNPLAGPNGICITPDGNSLYLADYTAQRIKKINIANGVVTNYAGNGTSGYTDGSLLTAKFSYPTGIKISSDGLFLYICDNNNCLIRKIDIAAGTVSTVAGVYNAFAYSDNANGMLAQFNQPHDLVVAPGDSVLYISDAENHVIRKLNLLTTAVTTIAGTPGVFGYVNGAGATAKFRTPGGLAISPNAQSLYIADMGNHKIRKIEIASNTVSNLAGSTQGYADNAIGTLASFYTPKGIALLKNDSILYVMDSYNDRIRTVNLTTTAVSTVAGSASSPTAHFADNPNGLLAKFYRPVTAALSISGDKLYISDQENFRVRTMNTDVVLTSLNENISTNDFLIYPNPVNDYLNIQLKTIPNADYTYSITDIQGKEIISEKEKHSSATNRLISLKMKGCPAGMYIMRLTIENKIHSIKIIKE